MKYNALRIAPDDPVAKKKDFIMFHMGFFQVLAC